MLNDIQIKNLRTIHEICKAPVYLFDRERFISNFLSLQTEFGKIYHNTKIAYSYKTNPTAAICRLVHRFGGLAEVVSPMELYHAAENLCIDNPNIIMNGVCQCDNIKAVHAKCGGIVNVDSLCEFERLAKLLHGSGAKLGIRVMTNLDTRFGMSDEEINRSIQLALENGITISGIHCHDGSGRTIDIWKRKTARMIETAEKLNKFFKVEYIDLGGHLYGNMDERLKSQFGGNVAGFKEYASAVGGAFFSAYGKSGPTLILEPGTALVGDAVSVLASVADVKERERKSFAVLDVCCYDIGCMAKDRPIDLLQDKVQQENGYIISGYTCVESDVLHRDFKYKLNCGDLVLIQNCGAYSNALKPRFIMPSMAMLQVNGEFEAESVIKRAELNEDVYSDCKEG